MRRRVVFVTVVVVALGLLPYLPGSPLGFLSLGRLFTADPGALAVDPPSRPSATPSRPLDDLPSPPPSFPPSPTPSPTPVPPKPSTGHVPFFGKGPVTVTSGGFLGWAWLDRVTGVMTTSANK